MTENEKPAGGGEELPRQVVFDYIKSNYFRVIHADGAIGGVTPGLGIHIAFFNERAPIPQQTVFQINEDNTLGEEIRGERVARKGIVREVEVDVMLDVDAAVKIVGWLQKRIEDVKKAREEISKAKQ